MICQCSGVSSRRVGTCELSQMGGGVDQVQPWPSAAMRNGASVQLATRTWKAGRLFTRRRRPGGRDPRASIADARAFAVDRRWRVDFSPPWAGMERNGRLIRLQTRLVLARDVWPSGQSLMKRMAEQSTALRWNRELRGIRSGAKFDTDEATRQERKSTVERPLWTLREPQPCESCRGEQRGGTLKLRSAV